MRSSRSALPSYLKGIHPTYGPILSNGMMRMGVAVGSSYLLTSVLTAAISNAAIAGFAANMASQVASAVAVNVLRVISTATQAGAKPVVVAEDQERVLVVSGRNAERARPAAPPLTVTVSETHPLYPEGILPLMPPGKDARDGFPQAQVPFLNAIEKAVPLLPQKKMEL